MSELNNALKQNSKDRIKLEILKAVMSNPYWGLSPTEVISYTKEVLNEVFVD